MENYIPRLLDKPSKITRPAAIEYVVPRKRIFRHVKDLQRIKARGYKILTGMAPLIMNPFGMIMFQVYGLIELIADKDYGEILGINMIGDEVCEMAGEAVLAIQLEATVDDLASALFPHPTLSESLSEAARDCLGATLYIPQSG